MLLGIRLILLRLVLPFLIFSSLSAYRNPRHTFMAGVQRGSVAAERAYER